MRSTVHILVSLIAYAINGDARRFLTDRALETGLYSDVLPDCAQTCLNQTTPIYGCEEDVGCLCASSQLRGLLDVCVTNHCERIDSLESRESIATACNDPVRDRGDAVAQLSWALFGLSTFFFLGRLLSRIICLGGAGFYWDDWMVISGYLPFLGLAICIQLAFENGLGQDDYRLQAGQIRSLLKQVYAGQILYNYVTTSTKLSILLLYTRTWWTAHDARVFRYICCGIMSMLVLTFAAVELATIFQCTPINDFWSSTSPQNGHCIDYRSLVYAFGALNICYDIVILSLPIPLLLTLDIQLYKKLGICSIFLTGIIVTICTIGRLNSLLYIPLPSSYAPSNPSWNYTPIVIWTILEINFSIICSCLPGLTGLLQRIYHRQIPAENCMTTLSSSTSTLTLSPTTNVDAQEILPGEDRRTSNLGHQVVEVPNQGIEDLPGSPALHVGVSEKMVAIQHTIPDGPTRDKFVYKDGYGILHEVEVTDRPQGAADKGANQGRESDEGGIDGRVMRARREKNLEKGSREPLTEKRKWSL